MAETAREAASRLLDRLVEEFGEVPAITPGRMPSGPGYRYAGKFFAYVTRDGDLVVKLPEGVVRGLIAVRRAQPFILGVSVAKEWAQLPPANEYDLSQWREALRAAVTHAEAVAAAAEPAE